MLEKIYGQSLSLLTDLYQLTMAYGYWKGGMAGQEAVFHLFFRNPPFGGSHVMSCGQSFAVEYLENFGFAEDDIQFLSTLQGNDGNPLFETAFLDYLIDLQFTGNLFAVPEGEIVFANEPILRVQAPIIEAQIVETALLNLINFPSLIATKANRIVQAAGGDPVLEFGLRRAQGIDGGLTASRAAYIGGCSATSNVLAGKLFDIPIKGTHAHSWVMAFDTEREAFESYATAMPNNCVFLVDTYQTIDGVREAVRVGKALREKGHEMIGIRLDSGDLLELSVTARQILDENGFPEADIVASNNLNEQKIAELRRSGARIGVWGVGTQLSTAYDQPALGGVYKLSAIRDHAGAPWKNRVKLSDDPIKTSIPGVQQVRRIADGEGRIVEDLIWSEIHSPPLGKGRDLLQPSIVNGVSKTKPVTARESRRKGFESLSEMERRAENFKISIEPKLGRNRAELIQSFKP